MLRRPLTITCLALALALPVANAFGMTREARSARAKVVAATKVVTTETVLGTDVKCHQWGFMELQLKVIKTEVTTGSKETVSLKIAAVSYPITPNHTPRSIYINKQAIPLLLSETVGLQVTSATDVSKAVGSIINISGASNSTVSWNASLQAALTKAEQP